MKKMSKYLKFIISTLVGGWIIMIGMSLRSGLEALWANGGSAFATAFTAAWNRYLTVGNIITVILEAAVIYGAYKFIHFISSKPARRSPRP